MTSQHGRWSGNGAPAARAGVASTRLDEIWSAMNTYPAERSSRRATMAFLLMIATIATIALSLGLGWWIWENLINNPLPYRDPEALPNEPWGVRGVRTAAGAFSSAWFRRSCRSEVSPPKCSSLATTTSVTTANACPGVYWCSRWVQQRNERAGDVAAA